MITTMYGIWLFGYDAYPVAIFRLQEDAENWGKEYYYGRWLLKEIKLDLPPLATEEEWKEAELLADEMEKKLNEFPTE